MIRHHRAPRRPATRRRVLAGVAAAAAVAAVTAVIAQATDGSVGAPSDRADSVRTTRVQPTIATPTTTVRRPSPSSSPSPSASPSRSAVITPTPRTKAEKVLDRLVAEPAPGESEATGTDASVAALDLTSKRSVVSGSTAGMTIASVGKVQVLEAFLLDRQLAHRPITESDERDLTAMIVRSSNEAADRVFRLMGPTTTTLSQDQRDAAARRTVIRLAAQLGTSPPATRQGDGVLWGLTTTSAAQEVRLLRNLVDATASPLGASQRAYALDLMRDVEADQRWGVSAAADDGRIVAIKDGWLPVATDRFRWADNSIGILRLDGHLVLIAVLTQHNDTDEHGRTRVERLARAAVKALSTS